LPGPRVERPWAVPAEAVAEALATDPAAGLTAAEEAADGLQRFGPNELVERGRKPAWRLLAEPIANTIILVLVAAGLATAVIGDLKDMVVILAIVVLNAVVGFVQDLWDDVLRSWIRVPVDTFSLVKSFVTLIVVIDPVS
jgi:magnesium-transporting ATPase (P-type)